jgi:hypothetical protein
MFTPKSAIVNALELKLNGQVVDWEGNTLKDKQGVDLNY